MTTTTTSPVGAKLPQWWLDNTPHDTLEEQVERRRIEEEKELSEEEENEEEDNVIICGDTTDHDIATDYDDLAPLESRPLNGHANGNDFENTKKTNGYKRSTAPRSAPITPEEFECTDYKVERANLKHIELQEKTKNTTASPTKSMGSPLRSPWSPTRYSQNANSPVISALPESAPATVSPETAIRSTKNTPNSFKDARKPRKFKTAFTGVSPFDFAMQQRAREQERREKERLARESLSRHHAETAEYDRVSEQKQKYLEEKRKKKEAEEYRKQFKGVTLDSDLATELKRRHMEEKRKKKEACEQHHEYKSTS